MGNRRLELPEEVLALLAVPDQQVERAVLELVVLDLYRRHTISAGRAAELLGIDEFAFIRHASALGIPYFDMTREELHQELERVRTWWPANE